MKKKTFIILLCLFIVLPLMQVNADLTIQAYGDMAFNPDDIADLSYAFGMVLGSDLKQTGLEFDYNAFIRGFRDVMENLDTRIALDEADQIVDTAIYEAMSAQAELNHQMEVMFLAQNAERQGVFTTLSGLQYEIITEGTGEQPSASDYVKVHYTGFLINGTVFDSSIERGEPEEFPLEAVIPGWSEGIQLLREGGKNRIFIPSRLAYGTRGIGGIIPPNSVLVFDVELIEILEIQEDLFWDIEYSD